MADSNPNYTTVDKFNDDVKKWTVSTGRKIRTNIKSNTRGKGKDKARGAYSVIATRETKPEEKKLAQSVSYGLRKRNGETERIRFSFERHGVFLHYGVGRGYIKNGDTVVRGVRSGKKEFIVKDGSINRKPVDWFDSELDKNMASLADIAVEYHGDEALQQILEINKNAKIDGK